MRWRMGATAVVAAVFASTPALAAGGYSVHVSAASPVAAGHSFRIEAHGATPQRALLYVHLDTKPCLKKWTIEASRVYRTGESYFEQKQGAHHLKTSWDPAWVSGSFDKSFTAHAGTTAERERVCAYLAKANQYGGYRITVALVWSGFTVTS